MNKILGISNGNYIDMLLSKKTFSFKINKLSTTDNILNGKPCDVLYTGYLNKDISFGDIVYFYFYYNLFSGVELSMRSFFVIYLSQRIFNIKC